MREFALAIHQIRKYLSVCTARQKHCIAFLVHKCYENGPAHSMVFHKRSPPHVITKESVLYVIYVIATIYCLEYFSGCVELWELNERRVLFSELLSMDGIFKAVYNVVWLYWSGGHQSWNRFSVLRYGARITQSLIAVRNLGKLKDMLHSWID